MDSQGLSQTFAIEFGSLNLPDNNVSALMNYILDIFYTDQLVKVPCYDHVTLIIFDIRRNDSRFW